METLRVRNPNISSMDSMDSQSEVYSWPTGWKDLRKPSTLPSVLDSKQVSNVRHLHNRKDIKTSSLSSAPVAAGNVSTLPTLSVKAKNLSRENSAEQSLIGLPTVNLDGPSLDNIVGKRKPLKRRSKVYTGLGSLFPQLNGGDNIYNPDSTLDGGESPDLPRTAENESGSPVESNFKASQSSLGDTRDVAREMSKLLLDDPVEGLREEFLKSYKHEGAGFGVCHNGLYFEVLSDSPNVVHIDKRQLKSNSQEKLQQKEEYIKARLLTSQTFLLNDDEKLLTETLNSQIVSDPQLTRTPSKTKMVTFSPETDQTRQLSPNKTLLSPLVQIDKVMNSITTKTRHGLSIKPAASKDDFTDTDSQNKPNLQQHDPRCAAQRNQSPWKKKFEERLHQITQRSNETSRRKRPGIAFRKITNRNDRKGLSEVAEAPQRNAQAETLIRNSDKSIPEPAIGNYNVSEERSHAIPTGKTLHGAYVKKRTSEIAGRSRHNESGLTIRDSWEHRSGGRVEATATRRKDYVFQFSQTDRHLPTGRRTPKDGGIQEWSVEYLGFNANIRSPRASSNYSLAPNEKRDGMSSTLSRERRKEEFSGPEHDMDTDMPVLLRVDTSKGYERTELTTLPMLATKPVHDEPKPNTEKNRLYVGSTVRTSTKRKHSKRSTSKRIVRKKKHSSTIPSIDEHKTGRGTKKRNKNSNNEKSGDIQESRVVADDVKDTSSPEMPVLIVQNDNGVAGTFEIFRDESTGTPSSIFSCLKVQHPNTARSSAVTWGGHSFDEEDIDEAEDDNLGDLIQVSQVQRSPRPRHKSQPVPLPPIGARFEHQSRYGDTTPRFGDRGLRYGIGGSRFSDTSPSRLSDSAVSRYGETSRLSDTGDHRDEESRSRQEMRTDRMRPWMKPAPQNFNLPRLQVEASMGMTSSLAVQAREDINRVISEIEKMRWNQEQHEERVATYNHTGFMLPRVVLVSSSMPRCHSMRKAVRKDKNVIFLVYDFDTWSFDDILKTIRIRLDEYHEGCRMHSVLFLCGGGVGFCYLLKNYVMTPQKLQRPDYTPVVEFWKHMGNMISKLKPEEAAITIMGCCLDDDKQGREVLGVVKKAVHPNIVRVESPSEHMAEGRKALNQYFVYRRFLLWRSTASEIVHRISTGLDKVDRGRTWSELAEDAESDS